MRQRGVSGILRNRRITRHWGEHVRTVDEKDLGNRPGIAKVLGFGDVELDGPPEHDPATCGIFGCERCLAS